MRIGSKHFFGAALASLVASITAMALSFALAAAVLAVVAIACFLFAQRRQWEGRERELKESLAAADEIIGAIPSGLVSLDADGSVRRWNTTARRILGSPGQSARGASLADWPLPGQEGLRAMLADALAGREVRRGSLELRGKDGQTLPLGISTTCLRTGDGAVRGAVAIFQDLTDVRRMQVKAKQQERLAAVGALSASIAHEIRNPLASIAGSVEMLAAELDLGGDMQELVDLILRESDRLNGLIEDFLDYARERDAELKPIETGGVLKRLMLALRQRTEAGDGLRLILRDGGGHTVDADSDLLQQAFLNIALNACQAMEWRGTLQVSAVADGACLDFLFTDDGPGVPPADRQRLFEPFFTTRPGGTGLGMAIAHRIAQRHGGSLELLPSEVGACFRFRIPMVATSTESNNSGSERITQ